MKLFKQSTFSCIFLFYFVFLSSIAFADCQGVATTCISGLLEVPADCQSQQGCGWVSGAGLSNCGGLAYPCNSFANETTCGHQQGCTWVTPPIPFVPDGSGTCPQSDINICASKGASCFLSVNNGTHPNLGQPPPRGYNRGDYVSLCWWQNKNQASCPQTAKGGFWSTDANFGTKFGWSPPPGGWNPGQCMSQCANLGGGFAGPTSCMYP
jgi:hypothetical protein